jgi:LacI family transcriptional regulator
MKDIADSCGVSRTTVSFALNNRYDGNVKINEALRDKIKRTAQKMGYQPNRNAAALRKGRNPAIGIFLPPYRSELISDMVFGMSDISLKHRCPVFYSSGYTREKFSQFLENAERMSNSGIIIYFAFNDTIYQPEFRSQVDKMIKNGQLDDFPFEEIEAKNNEYYEIINNFATSGGKVMLINEVPEFYQNDDSLVKYVCCDDIEGGRLAAEHLIECDCQEFFMMHTYSHCDRDRLQGFKKCLEQAGKKHTSFAIWGRHTDELSAETFFGALEKVKRGKKAVGLFVSSDYLAITVYEHLKTAGFAIGKDIKIAGYNNLESARYMEPGLTTLRQPFREAGTAAMESIITMLDGGQVKSQVVKPELIIRASTQS